jgi:hypothetical protein
MTKTLLKYVFLFAALWAANAHPTNQTTCTLTPDRCGSEVVPPNCPAGRLWSLVGSGVAHCVNVNPVCSWGYSLKHDSLGHPSCVQNTCPSNMVLQGNGISCGCPAHLPIWNGASCVAAPPPPPPPPPPPSDDLWQGTSIADTDTGNTMYYFAISDQYGRVASDQYATTVYRYSKGCDAISTPWGTKCVFDRAYVRMMGPGWVPPRW